MSESRQTCSYCGWSKITTYQGLRIHQAKMGCTPKEPVSYTPPPVKKETYESVTPKYNPQPLTKIYHELGAETHEKLRSCHCGWSKVTSYQGLRIHQGKMGCTPKGLRIPENEQGLFNSPAAKYEDTPKKPQEEKRRNVNDNYETPQQHQPSTAGGAKARRALDFSTRGRQDSIKGQIKSRKQELSEVRSSLKAGKASLDEEWEDIDCVFAAVIEIVKEARERERNSLKNRREFLDSEANSLIRSIQKDLDKLDDALYEVDIGEDVDMGLLPMKSKDYSLSTSYDFGTLLRNISTMKKQIQEKVDQLSAKGREI